MPIKKADGSIVPDSQWKSPIQYPEAPPTQILVPVPVVGPPGPSSPLSGDVTGNSDNNTVEAIQGFSVALVTPNVSDVLMWDGTKLVFAPQQSGVDFHIDSFTSVENTLRQVGETLPSVSFTVSYSVPAQSAYLKDSAYAVATDLVSPYTSVTQPGPFQSLVNGGQVLFILEATLGAITQTSEIIFQWGLVRYRGPASKTAVIDEAFITGTGFTGTLGLNQENSFTASCGVNECIYYCVPSPSVSGFSEPTFSVGGFEGGFEQVGTSINVTNVHGVTTPYDVWRTVQTNLGTLNVVVS